MGNQLEQATAELVSARDVAELAYQSARSEIGYIQADETSDIADVNVREAALRAYELESVVRGYAMRVESGRHPTRAWMVEFAGTWRFYNEANFSDTYERMSQKWHAIRRYVDVVRQLDSTLTKFFKAAGL